MSNKKSKTSVIFNIKLNNLNKLNQLFQKEQASASPQLANNQENALYVNKNGNYCLNISGKIYVRYVKFFKMLKLNKT